MDIYGPRRAMYPTYLLRGAYTFSTCSGTRRLLAESVDVLKRNSRLTWLDRKESVSESKRLNFHFSTSRLNKRLRFDFHEPGACFLRLILMPAKSTCGNQAPSCHVVEQKKAPEPTIGKRMLRAFKAAGIHCSHDLCVADLLCCADAGVSYLGVASYSGVHASVLASDIQGVLNISESISAV